MGLGVVDLYAFIVLLLSFGILYLSGGVLNFFNPASLFFLFHVLLFSLGSWYRWFYEGRVWVSDDVVFIVYTSLLLYALGVFSVAAVMSPPPNLSRVLVNTRAVELGNLGCLMVLIVPVLISLVYSQHVGGIVWAQSNIDNLRVNVRQGIGWLALLGIASAFVGVLFYTFSRRKISWLGGGVVILILSSCAASYGNRAPGADVFIAGIFSLFIVKTGRLPVLRILIFVSIAFLVVVMAGLYRQGFDISLSGILVQSLWRPFVNFQNFQILYDAFPLMIPYQWGNGYLIDLSVLMPGYQVNYSTWLKEMLQMDFSGGGINQTYLGEFFTNFSLIPALFCSFLLGASLQLLYCLMCTMRCSLQLMLIVAFSFKSIVSSGVMSPLLYSLIPFILIYLVYRVVLGVAIYEKA